MTIGRLIFPFVAEIHRLAASPMDPDFREAEIGQPGKDDLDVLDRIELPSIRVPCQVEPEACEAMNMLASGNSPRTRLELVFHVRDLERLDLIEQNTGNPLIHPGDRLQALYGTSGALVQTFRNPPGVFVREARPIGFGLGLGRATRNLLLVSFDARSSGIRSDT
jgi:hypothetical protein